MVTVGMNIVFKEVEGLLFYDMGELPADYR
jgi:hypothetical protein